VIRLNVAQNIPQLTHLEIPPLLLPDTNMTSGSFVESSSNAVQCEEPLEEVVCYANYLKQLLSGKCLSCKYPHDL
jgi:hypothetical protein